MPSPSQFAHHDVTHSLTHTGTSLFADARWGSWCRLLSIVLVLIGLLGLGLPGTIGAEGLALDVPTAPVHLAATSAESAEMTVNLSDPTKFPFSSTGKWNGLSGIPGQTRHRADPWASPTCFSPYCKIPTT